MATKYRLKSQFDTARHKWFNRALIGQLRCQVTRTAKSFEMPISWYGKRNKTLEKPHRLANTERSGAARGS